MACHFETSFFALSVLCFILRISLAEKKKPTLNPTEAEKMRNDYVAFRRNWLSVYLLIMAGDWLQGPYLYALYSSYGYPLEVIAVLYVSGYISSAIFGTMVGSIADRYGRKKLCLTFCVLYSASCITKFYRDYNILLLGRLLSGVSTSLLFSVFEAWMVAEHNVRGFPSAWITETFSWASFGNGLVAMVSGVVANFLSAYTETYAAPYAAAMILFAIAFAIVSSSWKENYGSRGSSSGSSLSTIRKALALITTDKTVMAIGGIQAFFEGAMYTFVFLWGPTLQRSIDVGKTLPFGYIFASFMVCIMIGSMLFTTLRNIAQYTPYQIARPLFALGCFALSMPAYLHSAESIFWSFNLFEVVCGMYSPMIGTLRSTHLPDELRATLMNIFRVPLNIIVVTSLINSSNTASHTIFLICSCLMVTAFLFTFLLDNDTKGVSGELRDRSLKPRQKS